MKQNTLNNLIEALEREKRRFSDNGHDTEGHRLAIHYLKTGEVLGDLTANELLDACVNDFEFVYETYCPDNLNEKKENQEL